MIQLSTSVTTMTTLAVPHPRPLEYLGTWVQHPVAVYYYSQYAIRAWAHHCRTSARDWKRIEVRFWFHVAVRHHRPAWPVVNRSGRNSRARCDETRAPPGPLVVGRWGVWVVWVHLFWGGGWRFVSPRLLFLLAMVLVGCCLEDCSFFGDAMSF
jgi:hypothetical protein